MPQPRKHTTHAARQAAYRKRQEEARRTALLAKGLLPLPAIPAMPGNPRWNQIFDNTTQMLQGALEQMEAYSEERSEAWQESEAAERHQERMTAIQEIVDMLEAVPR
jgi:hypothetical protein